MLSPITRAQCSPTRAPLQGVAHPLPMLPNWSKLGDTPLKMAASLLAIAPILLNADICHQSVFPRECCSRCLHLPPAAHRPQAGTRLTSLDPFHVHVIAPSNPHSLRQAR
jgi:hypothetical protein